MTQPLSYTINVDAQQAQREVKKLEEEFHRAGVAAVSAGRSMDNAAKPTRNTGMAFLDLSRAVEDAQYGLRGIQNNIPGLVAALGGGAGLAGGISLATIAVTQLYEHFNKVPDVAAEAMKATITRVGELREELAKAQEDVDALFYGADAAEQRGLEERMKKAKDAAKAVFEPFGGEEAYRAFGFLTPGKGVIEHTLDEMFGEAGERGAKRISQEMVDAAKAAAEEIDHLTSLQESRTTARALREFNRVEAEKKREAERRQREAEAEAEAAVKRLAKSLEDSFSEAVKRSLTVGSMTSISDAMNSTVERGGFGLGAEIRKAQLAAISDEDLLAAAPAYNIDSEAQKALQPFRDEIVEEHKARAKLMADITVDAFSMVGDAIAAAASGQEDAWANLLGAAAKYAGDQITLLGGKTLAEGIASATTPATAPLAPGQIAAGLGLIAAGQAISVGGAAAVGALTGQAGGSANTARDRGAAPSRAAPGGSGDLTVNVSYGVAGPLPEDTARAIARAVSTGDRRRGAR